MLYKAHYYWTKHSTDEIQVSLPNCSDCLHITDLASVRNFYVNTLFLKQFVHQDSNTGHLQILCFSSWTFTMLCWHVWLAAQTFLTNGCQLGYFLRDYYRSSYPIQSQFKIDMNDGAKINIIQGYYFTDQPWSVQLLILQKQYNVKLIRWIMIPKNQWMDLLSSSLVNRCIECKKCDPKSYMPSFDGSAFDVSSSCSFSSLRLCMRCLPLPVAFLVGFTY